MNWQPVPGNVFGEDPFPVLHRPVRRVEPGALFDLLTELGELRLLHPGDADTAQQVLHFLQECFLVGEPRQFSAITRRQISGTQRWLLASTEDLCRTSARGLILDLCTINRRGLLRVNPEEYYSLRVYVTLSRLMRDPCRRVLPR